MTETTTIATAPAPLLLDAQASANLCAVSKRTWWAWHSGGYCPLPVRIGGGRVVRWRSDELRDWCAAGCPPREKWIAMKEARP